MISQARRRKLKLLCPWCTKSPKVRPDSLASVPLLIYAITPHPQSAQSIPASEPSSTKTALPERPSHQNRHLPKASVTKQSLLKSLDSSRFPLQPHINTTPQLSRVIRLYSGQHESGAWGRGRARGLGISIYERSSGCSHG